MTLLGIAVGHLLVHEVPMIIAAVWVWRRTRRART